MVWRQGCHTFITARPATLLWTWRKSTKAFSGRRRSSLSSSRSNFQRSLWQWSNATLSFQNWSGSNFLLPVLSLKIICAIWGFGPSISLKALSQRKCYSAGCTFPALTCFKCSTLKFAMKNAHETKAARYTIHTPVIKDMKMLFWRD